MKKFYVAFLAVAMIIAVCCAIPAAASSGSEKKYVIDELDVLTDSEEAELEQKLQTLSDKYNMDFVFISVQSAGHNDWDRIAFADDTYDYGGYRTDGVLYMYEEESTFKYLSTSGRAIHALDAGESRGYYDNSAIIDDILDDIEYYTDMHDYYRSVNAFIDGIDYYVGYYLENGSAYVEPPVFPLGLCVFLALATGVVVGFVKHKKEKSKLNTVALNPYAGLYIVENSLNIRGGNDRFLYSTVTKRPKPEPSRSGGAHTHSGSSGASHGGGGRH